MLEMRVSGEADVESTEMVDSALEIWGMTSPVLLAGGFKSDSANKIMDEYLGNDIVVVFWRQFILNPDLPSKIKTGLELTEYDRETFYKAQNLDGYTDYPFSQEWRLQERL